MHLDGLITLISIGVFATLVSNMLWDVIRSLMARRLGHHQIVLEIDGKVIKFDPSSSGLETSAAIDNALATLHDRDRAA